MRKTTLFLLFVFSTLLFGSTSIKINEVIYYGDFQSQNYLEKYNIKNKIYVNQGESKKIKLPVKIDNWPANEILDAAPEIIVMAAEIENLSDKTVSNLTLKLKVRYKVSKTVYDKDGYIEYEKSIKNLEWDDYFIEKEIKIESLGPKKKKIIKLDQINVYKSLDEYDVKNMHPWICQASITVKNGNSKFCKEIEIGYVW